MTDHEGRDLHDKTPAPAAARRGVVAAAGHTGDLETVRRGLSDPEPAVRATALNGLCRLGHLGFSELEAGLTDEAASVRARAAEMSWRSGLRADLVVPLLTARLSDEDSVTEAACFALGELQAEEAVDKLGEIALHHEDPLCREAAVAALGAIGASGGLSFVLEAMKDRPAVRRRAVIALAAFEGEKVEAALTEALGDRDWQVRQAAEDLLGARPT
jgi:HEAT repeat protein